MNSENQNEMSDKKNHSSLSKKILLVLITALILMIMWGIFSVFMSFFKVSKIVIDGEMKYLESEIIEAGSVEVGMNVRKIDADKLEEKLKRELPYISDAKVKVGAFGKLKIHIIEDEAKYYTQISKNFFALNNDFRILESSEDKNLFSHLIYINLPIIKSAITGERVLFYSEDTELFVRGFASDLNESFLGDKMISIDASDKYNLSIVCYDYDVIFGSYKDMSKKFGYVELMEKDTVVKEREGVILDVSNPEAATIKFKTN